MVVAERVHSSRDSAEDKQVRAEKRQNQGLAKILLAGTAEPEDRKRRLRQLAPGKEGKENSQRLEGRPQLSKNQCAYGKEKEHWAKECPKNKSETLILVMGNDSD